MPDTDIALTLTFNELGRISGALRGTPGAPPELLTRGLARIEISKGAQLAEIMERLRDGAIAMRDQLYAAQAELRDLREERRAARQYLGPVLMGLPAMAQEHAPNPLVERPAPEPGSMAARHEADAAELAERHRIERAEFDAQG